MIRAALLSCALAGRAPAQIPPTRLAVVTTVLEVRRQMFEQAVSIDGCSLSTMMDSVSTSMGTLGAEFAPLVRGTIGGCAPAPSGELLPRRVVTFGVMLRRGAEQVDQSLPADVRASVIMLALNVQDTRSQESHSEVWYLRPFPDGRVQVLSMRAGGMKSH